MAVSAQHGDGMADLYAALSSAMADILRCEAEARASAAPPSPSPSPSPSPHGLPPPPPHEREGREATAKGKGSGASAEATERLQLAIVGKPNVGKSTLVNALLGDERVLTGPQPGVTRDAITVNWITYRNAQSPRSSHGPKDAHAGGKHSAHRHSKGSEDCDDGAAAGKERTVTATVTSPSASAEDCASPGGESPAVAAAVEAPVLQFQLIDTAGLKGVTAAQMGKYARVDEMAMRASVRAIGYANVVALCIDASDGIDLFADVIIRSNKILDAARLAQEYERASPAPAPAAQPRPRAGTRAGTRSGRAHSNGAGVSAAVPTPDEVQQARLAVQRVMSHDDIAIARYVVRQGRALVVVANKWDRLAPERRETALFGLQLVFETVLGAVRGVPVIPVSALEKKNLSRIVPTVVKQYNKYARTCTVLSATLSSRLISVPSSLFSLFSHASCLLRAGGIPV